VKCPRADRSSATTYPATWDGLRGVECFPASSDDNAEFHFPVDVRVIASGIGMSASGPRIVVVGAFRKKNGDAVGSGSAVPISAACE